MAFFLDIGFGETCEMKYTIAKVAIWNFIISVIEHCLQDTMLISMELTKSQFFCKYTENIDVTMQYFNFMQCKTF